MTKIKNVFNPSDSEVKKAQRLLREKGQWIKKQIRDIKNQLLDTELFAGCESDLKAINQEVDILNYNLGEKIIDYGLLENKPYAEDEQFRAPPVVTQHGIVCLPAKDILSLGANPLFVVLDGRVEIHRSGRLGLEDNLETYPLLMVIQPNTFGEFEIDPRVQSDQPHWNPYRAEATAGWRTVHLNSAFGNTDVWKLLAGEEIAPKGNNQNNPEKLKDILYRTFTRWGCHFVTKIAIIPQPTIKQLYDNSTRFLRNYFEIYRLHEEWTWPLRQEQVLLHKSKKVVDHFVEYTVPRLLNGQLPVLLPCTEFKELEDWWRKIHEKITNVIQINSVTLPFVFFVPSSGNEAVRKSEISSEKRYPTWVLSRAMIRKLTADKALWKRRNTQESYGDKDFIITVKQKLKDNLDFDELTEIKNDVREKMLLKALGQTGKKELEEKIQNYVTKKKYSCKPGILFHFIQKGRKEITKEC